MGLGLPAFVERPAWKWGFLAFSVCLALGMSLVDTSSCHADVESLTILQSSSVACGRRKCIQIRARMNGTAPGGAYSVPVRFLYPANPRERNGTALLDIVNSTFEDFTYFDTADSAPEWVPPQPLASILMGDGFLGERGYTYLEVNWDKLALFLCDLLGNEECGGEVAVGTDGYQIVRDAAALLKNPVPELVGIYGYSPPEISLAFGFSQSSYLLQQIYKREGMSMSLDGILLAGTDSTCLTLLEEFPWWTFLEGCEGPMPETVGKAITALTETDIEQGGFLLRGETDWDRTYEISGIAHISKDLADLSDFSAFRQNPVSISPVLRAMLENLRLWIQQGERPPDNAYLNPTGGYFLADLAPFLGIGPVPVFELEREGDCATGGLRLPHCRTQRDPYEIGAPLGSFNGIETEVTFDPERHLLFRASLASLGGTFTPFSLSQLNSLYPKHDSYLFAVWAAVNEALQRRWILPEDALDYLRKAARCPVGRKNFHPASPQLLREALEACINNK